MGGRLLFLGLPGVASPFQVCILAWALGAALYPGRRVPGALHQIQHLGEGTGLCTRTSPRDHSTCTLHVSVLGELLPTCQRTRWGQAGSEPGSESPAVRPTTCTRFELLKCLNGPQVTDPRRCPCHGHRQARGPWSTWMGPDPALRGPSSPGNTQSSPRREQRHHLDLINPWGSGLVTAVSCAPEVKAGPRLWGLGGHGLPGRGPRTHTDLSTQEHTPARGAAAGPSQGQGTQDSRLCYKYSCLVRGTRRQRRCYPQLAEACTETDRRTESAQHSGACNTWWVGETGRGRGPVLAGSGTLEAPGPRSPAVSATARGIS